MTPLIFAVSSGNAEIIKLLRSYGARADLAQTTGKGKTLGKTPVIFAREKWGGQRSEIINALTETSDTTKTRISGL